MYLADSAMATLPSRRPERGLAQSRIIATYVSGNVQSSAQGGMAAGALGLVLAALALIAASFAGRYAAARLLGVRDIGIFGPSRPRGGASVPALRRVGAHAGAPLGGYVVPVALFLLAFVVGGDRVASTVIEVLPGTPAEQAGLQDGDRIVQIEANPIDDWETLRQTISRRPNLPTRIQLQRGGQTQTVEVTPNAEGKVGLRPVIERRPMPLGSGLGRAALEPLRVVHMMLASVVRIFTGTERTELAGPVAISREVGKAQERSATDAFYLVGLLAAYVWPVFVLLEVLLAAAMWRDRRHKPPGGAAGP